MLPLKGLSIAWRKRPPKVSAVMAALFCMEPVATEMLPLCVCLCMYVCNTPGTYRTKLIPASALSRPVHSTVYFTSKQVSHLACMTGNADASTSRRSIAGLRGRIVLSLVFKTEGLVLWSGLVPTIPPAEQKDLELQKTELCSPWLKAKGHIGTTVAKRAIFQQPFPAGQIARASLCDTRLLLTATGCLTAMAVLKHLCFPCLQV